MSLGGKLLDIDCTLCGKAKLYIFQEIPAQSTIIFKCPACGGLIPIVRQKPTNGYVADNSRYNASFSNNHKLEEAFNRLENMIENYVKRPAQIDMATYAFRSIAFSRIYLVEAGVGTGKTFAYLIPIFLNKLSQDGLKGPVIISTKTINLQEQLYYKDIPVIMNLFLSSKTIPLKPLLSKGRRNYGCRNRLQSIPKTINNQDLIRDINEWLKNSSTCDLRENGMPKITSNILNKIAVEDCNPDCIFSQDCSFKRTKDERKRSNGIIVTNHNQLISDIRNRSQNKSGLWLKPSCIIIDEVHAFEEVARGELATKISVREISNFIARADRISRIGFDYQGVKISLEKFKEAIRRSLKTSALSTEAKVPIEITPELILAITDINEAVNDLAFNLSVAADTARDLGTKYRINKLSDEIDLLSQNLNEMSEILRSSKTEDLVFWKENNNYSIVMAPLTVDNLLNKHLWSMDMPFILTSATMKVENSFEHIKRNLGLNRPNIKTIEKEFGSEFNYKESVLIYIPKDLPEPKRANEDENEEDDTFAEAAAKRMCELITYSRGRALLLFTSYRRMEIAYNIIRQSGFEYTFLKQGQESNSSLLNKFRTDTSSVLLATGAFWEGTDVAGEALSLLVIDKLPFPIPSDPIIEGLIKREKKHGNDHFKTIVLPYMLNMLRQGGGRLIRQEGDKGVIALLDIRAWQSRYQEMVSSHLPPGEKTSSLLEVKNWFERI